ncbi:FHA domain-containing protein [Skermania sp. ID1734]|uniref:FHA domain-containing protein n=1 Tax=Skermania sp. ID1734 TaxID=2597516 RepID=UPI002102762F|nr:FHA domain-containing protein [Skermania sp. ID1734]
MSAVPAPRITIDALGTRREFDARSAVTIGRASRNRLIVDRPGVSRSHATVYWDNGWYVADAGSANGVYVDSTRIDQPRLIERPTSIFLGNPRAGVELTMIPAPVHQLTQRARTGDLPPVRRPMREAPVSRPTRMPTQGLEIGREAGCGVRVEDVLVSRRHARLVNDGGALAIDDLGSSNGTYVNGVRVRRAVLHEGDVLTVGNTDFTIVEGALRQRQRGSESVGVQLDSIDYAISGKKLLSAVSAEFRPGMLTAVVGPSGAGKSTMAKVTSGLARPTAGRVDFEGHDLHQNYDALQRRIGLVPQDEVIHRLLTVRQALRYAARLRLPPDTSRADREAVINGTLAELALTEHADTRIDHLSGGQRKRANVALELLTSPTLLILDEPTSGLDPHLDRQVMMMLRELADSGRIVLVITHTVANLDMCDRVLLLAPGGVVAYSGHPQALADTFGTTEWADIFAFVSNSPDVAHARYLAGRTETPKRPMVPPGRGMPVSQRSTGIGLQAITLARRQARLIFADTGYLLFLIAVPFVLGGLSLLVPGTSGFGPAAPNSFNEAYQLLIMLVLGACFMGATLSIRDLVGERAIYLRERAVGLSSTAYFLAKALVFWVAAILQSIALILTVTAVKPPPPRGVIIGSGTAELFIDIAATACSCVFLGLLMSSIARTSEQVMPMLVVMIMTQLVMCGGLITVSGRSGLAQASWFFPARWGFASAASTIDLQTITHSHKDDLWTHSLHYWLLDLGALAGLTIVFGAVVLVRLRARK